MKLGAALLPLFLISSPLLVGCAAPLDDDEAAVDATEDELTGAPSSFGYFQVTRPDLRKCAAPLCGGFFVRRVNEATTLCADGTRKVECYVSSIGLNGAGLSAREESDARALITNGKALVKARTYKQKVGGTTLGMLKGNEVWLGATGSPAEGTFFRAFDNGIRCIKAPCPTITVAALNGNDTRAVVDVVLDQTETKADPAKLAAALEARATKDGLLVAGDLIVPKCMADAACGPKVIATEFFLRLTPREGKACGAWALPGCNDGQFCGYAADAMCGAFDAPGKCAYEPDFCMMLYRPVCGCDGQTHGNACEAASHGTSVSSEGPCAPAPSAD